MTTIIKDILRDESANVNVILSLADLRQFFTEIMGQCSRDAAQEPNEAHGCHELMTVPEVCDYLGVTKPTLHRWNKLGYLTNVHVGRKVRYRREDVEAFAVK